jgi:hypothetical protein
MTLKAAYFSLVGLGESDVITWGGHIQPAIFRGRATPLHIAWPNQGSGHKLQAWSELLIGVRALAPATMLAPGFAAQVQRCGQRIWRLWRETLRYHKNRAYLYEVRQMHEITTWLLANADAL